MSTIIFTFNLLNIKYSVGVWNKFKNDAKTKLNYEIYNYIPSSIFFKSDEWLKLRYKVLGINRGCYQCCGRSYKKHKVILHVDHIKPRSKFPELSLEITNLQVLCAECNLGKGNLCSTDWR